MSDLEIVVRGRARGKYRRSAGVVDLAVHLEGPDKASVYAEAVRLHSDITRALARLESAGAVSRWTAESVRVYSYRPYSDHGERRDPVYNTRLRIDAEFGDFEKLSEFLDEWSSVEGVVVGGVDWDVTEESRRDHERELRREAVEDAIAKAQAYSDAVAGVRSPRSCCRTRRCPITCPRRAGGCSRPQSPARRRRHSSCAPTTSRSASPSTRGSAPSDAAPLRAAR